MKNFKTDKEAGMLVFYVLLDEPVEKKLKASLVSFSKGNLSLVVNR